MSKRKHKTTKDKPKKRARRRSSLEVQRAKNELKREQIEAIRLEATKQAAERVYEAAAPSNYHRVVNMSLSPDGVMDNARGKLRDWARYLDENHDLAIGILDVLVNNIVGTGIITEPMAMDRNGNLHEAFNNEARKLLSEWSKKPEVTGELSLNEADRLACRSWLRDGEIFTQHIQGRSGFTYATAVPYAFQLSESDMVPWDLSGTIHGVEKDAWGKPTFYHFYLEHPGSLTSMGFNLETRAVMAERISHLKFTRRVNQTRGVSIFHGIITRLDDIKDYEESERIAARVNAAFTGYIKKSTESSVDYDKTTGERQLEMNPGMIFDQLLPGEEVDTIGTNRPNPELSNFRNGQLRAAAAGSGTSYSSISKNYSEGSYSSQRQELVESHPGYTRLRDNFIAVQKRPMYERFIEMAILSGALRVPMDVDPATLTQADIRGPGMPWIKPKEEVEADALKVQNRFESRHGIIRQRGGDPSLVDKQIEMDLLPATEEPGDTPNEEEENEEEAA